MNNMGLVTAVSIVAITALVIWSVNSDAMSLETGDLMPVQLAGATSE